MPRAKNWNAILDELYEGSWNPALQRFRSPFAFRGLADAGHPLSSSLVRLAGDADIRRLETALLRNFSKYAHTEGSHADSVWDWLALGQHRGLPTRLLDWTYSPLVALHFVTESPEDMDRDTADIPVFGLIPAGFAADNPEVADGKVTLSLGSLGLSRSSRPFALRVRGDSMIEDGIRDGDLIVVRRAREAENGQTVVAVVDGEATLKRFHRATRDRVELRPANPAFQPIRVSADRVEIRGILVGLLRSYAS